MANDNEGKSTAGKNQDATGIPPDGDAGSHNTEATPPLTGTDPNKEIGLNPDKPDTGEANPPTGNEDQKGTSQNPNKNEPLPPAPAPAPEDPAAPQQSEQKSPPAPTASSDDLATIHSKVLAFKDAANTGSDEDKRKYQTGLDALEEADKALGGAQKTSGRDVTKTVPHPISFDSRATYSEKTRAIASMISLVALDLKTLESSSNEDVSGDLGAAIKSLETAQKELSK